MSQDQGKGGGGQRDGGMVCNSGRGTQGADKARHKVWIDPTNKPPKNKGEYRMQ